MFLFFSDVFFFFFCVVAVVRRMWLSKPWHMFWFILHDSNRALPWKLFAGRLDGGGNRYDGVTRTCTAGGAHRHIGYFERAGMDECAGSARNSGAGGFKVGEAAVAPREKSSEESAWRGGPEAGVRGQQREE